MANQEYTTFDFLKYLSKTLTDLNCSNEKWHECMENFVLFQKSEHEQTMRRLFNGTTS